MIRTNEVFKIGYITKCRGLRGEVEMQFTDDCFDTGTADYLVLDMDGILVPFFWEEYSFKNHDTAILKFEGTETGEQARRLAGHSVYYPKSCLPPTEADEDTELSSYKALTGFSVTDAQGRELGLVAQVDDSSANILLIIERPDRSELMLPFHNDFLLHFDLRERTLQLDVPEELLQLNG